MRVPIRRLLLLQPSRLRLRTTRPSLSSSFLSNQQWQPVFTKPKAVSSTLLVAGQGDMSAAYQKALKTFREHQALMARIGLEHEKEHRSIQDSFANFYLRPGAAWGFVIVRAVYGPASDAPWTKMLELLRSDVAESLAYANQMELLPRYQLTILEDEAMLAGADSYAARCAFRAWVYEDLPQRLTDKEIERHGGMAQVRNKLRGKFTIEHPAVCLPPRWQFCVFVDADCLRSLDMSSDLKVPGTKVENFDNGLDTE